MRLSIIKFIDVIIGKSSTSETSKPTVEIVKE